MQIPKAMPELLPSPMVVLTATAAATLEKEPTPLVMAVVEPGLKPGRRLRGGMKGEHGGQAQCVHPPKLASHAYVQVSMQASHLPTCSFTLQLTVPAEPEQEDTEQGEGGVVAGHVNRVARGIKAADAGSKHPGASKGGQAAHLRVGQERNCDMLLNSRPNQLVACMPHRHATQAGHSSHHVYSCIARKVVHAGARKQHIALRGWGSRCRHT